MAVSAQMTSDIVPLYSFILLSTFSDRKSEAEGEEEGKKGCSVEGVERWRPRVTAGDSPLKASLLQMG